MSSNNIYYVYAYLRSKDSKTAKAGTPYYIGKGKEKRAYSNHKSTPVPKDRFFIRILETNLTELGAFALERRLIRHWGRKDLKTGILSNLTDGGETPPSRKGITLSSSVVQKITAASTGRRHSQQTRDKISKLRTGMVFSDEHRKNLSKSHLGLKPSPESNAKRSIASSGRSWYNNGSINCFIKENPGPGWVKGRLQYIR